MQGTNPLTMQCTFVTPCGWCAKWDKKCDKKIPLECGQRAKAGLVEDEDPWTVDVKRFLVKTY